MKVLNLYAGIGGNRKLWENVEVTAIENVPEIAKIYKDLFPQDDIHIADAHQYLLEHYSEFDFIWSSPPCPSHSVTNNFQNAQGIIRYPDMKLWQEIIFLGHFAKSKWVVENVNPYYELLNWPVRAQESGRHQFWANFNITNKDIPCDFNTINARSSTRVDTGIDVTMLEKFHGFDLSAYRSKYKREVLRNCVNPRLGLHIFNCAFKEKQKILEVNT